MGAYENPVTVIDTESGDIWANAIRGFGKMGSTLINDRRDELLAENKAFAGRLQEIQKTGLKNYDVLANSLSERGITDQQIFDQARTFQNQKTKASTDLIRNLTPEQQAVAEKDYQQADTALKGLIPYVKSRGESMADYLEQIKSNPANVGKQGFASMTDNQEFQVGTWIDTGFLKGSKEIIYDKEKGWGTKYVESPEVESDYDGMNFVIWGTQAANYSVTDVPLVDKSLQAITQEVGIVDKNGKLTQGFMDLDSKSTGVTYNKDGSIKATTIGVNWKSAALAINNRVEQAAKLYLQDPREANAVWRNVFNQKEDLKIGPGGAIDPEQSKQFTEFLKLRAGQYIPNVDYIPGQSEIGEAWTQENPGAFQAQKFTGTNTPFNKGSGSEGGGNTNLDYIDKIDFSGVYFGPSRGGMKGDKINFNKLETIITKPPGNFLVKKASKVGDKEGITISKTVDGADRSVTIFDDSSMEEVRAQLRFLESGKSSEAKDKNVEFSLYLTDK